MLQCCNAALHNYNKMKPMNYIVRIEDSNNNQVGGFGQLSNCTKWGWAHLVVRANPIRHTSMMRGKNAWHAQKNKTLKHSTFLVIAGRWGLAGWDRGHRVSLRHGAWLLNSPLCAEIAAHPNPGASRPNPPRGFRVDLV